MTTLDKKQELESLLPFYVNGSLDDVDKIRLEKALSEDEYLREELAFVEILQKQVQQQSEQSPGEFGLKRLQRSLKQHQQQQIEQQSSQQTTQGKKAWQFAAIAASLMLVFQTVTIVQQTDDYRAAGGDNSVQAYADTVNVVFVSNATEQQIRQLLLEHNIVIIDGPSALGIYRLALTVDPPLTLNALQMRSDLIESIQQD